MQTIKGEEEMSQFIDCHSHRPPPQAVSLMEKRTGLVMASDMCARAAVSGIGKKGV